jgi:hypothetical protein
MTDWYKQEIASCKQLLLGFHKNIGDMDETAPEGDTCPELQQQLFALRHILTSIKECIDLLQLGEDTVNS